MLTVSIIALIVAIVAIAVAVAVYYKVKAFNNRMLELDREQVSINNLLRGVELRVDDLEKDDSQVVYKDLGGASYDEKTKTLTVFGNLKAEGWISCETILED